MKLAIPYAQSVSLDNHQIAAVCKFAKLPGRIRAIAWHRVGTGKTRLALALALQTIANKKLPCIILIIARPKAEYDWQAELKKINCDAYFTTDPDRVSFSKPTFLFVSFASLQSSSTKICRLPWLSFAILDELYLFSNPVAKRSKAAKRLVASLPCIGLGGTILTAADNSQVWGQAVVLGIERKLARHFSDYRTKYQNHIQVDFGYGSFPKFKNKPGWKEQALANLQDHVSIYFPSVLQRVTEKVITFPLSEEQKRLIHELTEFYFTEHEGAEYDFKYAFQVYNKIRGILNGWIKTPEGKKNRVASPKLDGLIASLHELHDVGESCLVWCAFHADVETIRESLKFASLQMVGGKEFDVATFNNGEPHIVLATMGSGSSVNHFRNVQHAKFFSLSYKKLDLEQAIGRQTRRDSTTTGICLEFYEASGSYDQDIRQNIRDATLEQTTLIQAWHNKILRTFTPSGKSSPSSQRFIKF